MIRAQLHGINMNKFYTYIWSAIMWLSVYFSPVYPMILSIGFFIIADLVTGIQAAKIRKEEIVSRKMKRTISKFIAYGISILVAHVMETQFLNHFPAMKLISGLIAYIELKSINENIETTTRINIFKLISNKIAPNKDEREDNN